MAAAGKKEDCFEGKGIVQVASYDYMALYTVEDYMDRVKNYRQLTSDTRKAICRMKELREDKTINDEDKREELTESMDITFRLRNFDIFQKSLSVRNAVEIYPGLQNYHEIRCEFERIMRKDVNEFERHLNCVLKEYARDQGRQKTYMCTNSFCIEALEIIRNGETNEAKKTAARIMIYACAQSQRKWSNVIYRIYDTQPLVIPPQHSNEDDKEHWGRRPHPTVYVFQSPFHEKCAQLYCEDTPILSNMNFYDAILACYFLYYIFNMDYPAVDAETFQPFDNVMGLMEYIPRGSKKI